MKKVLSFLLIGVYYLYAQSLTLEWVNPKPFGANLYDAFAFPPNVFLGVGVASTGILSTDGLTTYQMGWIDTSRTDIWGVKFVPNSGIYFCGDNGLIIKSPNLDDFYYQNSWVTSRLYDIDFLNADSGLVVGANGIVLTTTNGGENWVTKYYQTSSNYKIYIVNKDLIFIGSAYSGGQLAKSTNFGETWESVSVSGLSSSVYAIFFLDNLNGWVGTASNGIFYTSDGGSTWSQIMTSTNTIYDIKFITPQIGFAVDSKGIIYKTTNGGTTWSEYQTPAKQSLRVIVSDGSNLYAAGNAGALYLSTDFGETWIEKFQYISSALHFQRRVIFYDDNLGYICGGSSSSTDSLGYVLKTTDGGNSWYQLPYNFQKQLYAIAAPTENIIYASAGSSLVFKSTDGGTTWTKSVIYGTSTTLWDIQFYNEYLGYAAGSSGRIFKTTDGGLTWSILSSPFGTSTIYSIAILDSLTLIATGVSAKAYKSIDGGTTWIALSPGIPGSYFIVRFKGQTGYIGSYVSPSGYISKSTDGGNTWTALTSFPGTQSVWGIAIKDNNTVFVNDLYGYVYFSTNGGENWISVPRIMGTNAFYCSLAGDKLFITGSNGAIVKGTYYPGVPTVSTITYKQGWNILSIPVNAEYMTKDELFPEAISPAFGYHEDGYYIEDTLELTKGYWLKFGTDGSKTIIGYKSYQYIINLNEGWNLIGIFDFDISTENLITDPPGILASRFFMFDRGYRMTNQLNVGQGYWIKAIQPGNLIFPSPVYKNLPSVKDSYLNELSEQPHLTFTDKNENQTKLYFVTDKKISSNSELPPIPPSGIFDIRFIDNQFATIFDDKESIIQVNSAEYPLTIEASKLSIQITDVINGKLLNVILKPGEKFELMNSSINSIKVRPLGIIYTFELYQNYPNPFNPTTNIRFSLPEKSNVKLDVYNILGQKVMTILNEVKDAGIHSVNFDGSRLASGTYIYRLEAGKYSAIKKMVLMK